MIYSYSLFLWYVRLDRTGVISRTRKVYTPKFLRLWSLKTWRENFLLLAWKVKKLRATTKKFRCHFGEKRRPQF
ncbi:hypothetical protein CLI81_07115 [Porphyromonas gingivalis]|nr:hypothetical protein CLI80_00980 [Porphyromonas gingivalis]PDP72856.1 hypothetical protein CLI81_07115 [Porphyromonas gingivalis]